MLAAAVALVAGLVAGEALACDECLEDEAPPAQRAKPVQAAELVITDAGLRPSVLRVKAGVPLRLKITRTSQKRCATDFSVEGLTVPIGLPHGQAIELELTVDKPGSVRLRCGKAVSGTLVAS